MHWAPNAPAISNTSAIFHVEHRTVATESAWPNYIPVQKEGGNEACFSKWQSSSTYPLMGLTACQKAFRPFPCLHVMSDIVKKHVMSETVKKHFYSPLNLHVRSENQSSIMGPSVTIQGSSFGTEGIVLEAVAQAQTHQKGVLDSQPGRCENLLTPSSNPSLVMLGKTLTSANRFKTTKQQPGQDWPFDWPHFSVSSCIAAAPMLQVGLASKAGQFSALSPHDIL